PSAKHFEHEPDSVRMFRINCLAVPCAAKLSAVDCMAQMGTRAAYALCECVFGYPAVRSHVTRGAQTPVALDSGPRSFSAHFANDLTGALNLMLAQALSVPLCLPVLRF